ncbi:hypothetical protein Bbelb_088500 [Branchiostoma belcheri]|nr:hypothetical protein Bbelb_088500 [Branchiostoma belcheri]
MAVWSRGPGYIFRDSLLHGCLNTEDFSLYQASGGDWKDLARRVIARGVPAKKRNKPPSPKSSRSHVGTYAMIWTCQLLAGGVRYRRHCRASTANYRRSCAEYVPRSSPGVPGWLGRLAKPSPTPRNSSACRRKNLKKEKSSISSKEGDTIFTNEHSEHMRKSVGRSNTQHYQQTSPLL